MIPADYMESNLEELADVLLHRITVFIGRRKRNAKGWFQVLSRMLRS